MDDSGHVLLTGATGFLGRYLPHDLPTSGRRCLPEGPSAEFVEAVEDVLEVYHRP